MSDSDEVLSAHLVNDLGCVLEIFYKLQDDLGDENARFAATLTLAVCMLEAGSRAAEK